MIMTKDIEDVYNSKIIFLQKKSNLNKSQSESSDSTTTASSPDQNIKINSKKPSTYDIKGVSFIWSVVPGSYDDSFAAQVSKKNIMIIIIIIIIIITIYYYPLLLLHIIIIICNSCINCIIYT